jgi:hypothetical protein
VSHAAHDILAWTFHGTRLLATVNSKLKAVLEPIGLNTSSPDAISARDIGRKAAGTVVAARSDDGFNWFVDYEPKPAAPGVYQPTPGGSPIPDTPQAQFIRLFAALGDVTRFLAPPPPEVASAEYEAYLDQVKADGARNSTTRTPEETETV